MKSTHTHTLGALLDIRPAVCFIWWTWHLTFLCCCVGFCAESSFLLVYLLLLLLLFLPPHTGCVTHRALTGAVRVNPGGGVMDGWMDGWMVRGYTDGWVNGFN